MHCLHSDRHKQKQDTHIRITRTWNEHAFQTLDVPSVGSVCLGQSKSLHAVKSSTPVEVLKAKTPKMPKQVQVPDFKPLSTLHERKVHYIMT